MLLNNPDPFDQYRLENSVERDVFSILPPLGMNLGLGASKRGSVIDMDRESDVVRKDTEVTSPNKQGSSSSKGNVGNGGGGGGGHPKKTTPVSVADVLGLNSSVDDSPPSSFAPAPPTSRLPPLPPVLPSSTTPATNGSPSSLHSSGPSSSQGDTYSEPPQTDQDSLLGEDPVSPSRQSTSGSSTTLTSGDPPPFPSLEFLSASSDDRLERKSPSAHGRRLSRVSEREQENDPMAGNWDPHTSNFDETLTTSLLNTEDASEWKY